MKTITVEFWPEDHVRIRPLEMIPGRVIECVIGTDGRIEFKVKYYHNGEGKAEYFFADELDVSCKKTSSK